MTPETFSYAFQTLSLRIQKHPPKTPFIEKKIFDREGLYYPFLVWLLSRLFILFCFTILAPHFPLHPKSQPVVLGWSMFLAYDSEWYQKIALYGYEYRPDGEQHSIAFFPLFILLVKGLMLLGFPFAIAGTIINNACFLGSLYVIYHWVKQQHGLEPARWSTLFLGWCPLSLFGSVIYTEGLFLLMSGLSLMKFQEKQYFWSAIFGFLTTLTRLNGIALIPTFIGTAIVEKRSISAYLTAFITSLGIGCYSVYCWLNFNDLLAFLKVQSAWSPQESLVLRWSRIFAIIITGKENFLQGEIINIFYPILFLLTFSLLLILGRYCYKYRTSEVGWGVVSCLVMLWIQAGEILFDYSFILGSTLLLWVTRKRVRSTPFLYSLFSFVIIYGTGRTMSLERFTYGSISIAILWGLFLPRYRSIFIGLLFICLLILGYFSIHFAQKIWVA